MSASVKDISGIDEYDAEILSQVGYDGIDDVADADPGAFDDVPGISVEEAEGIIAEANSIVGNSDGIASQSVSEYQEWYDDKLANGDGPLGEVIDADGLQRETPPPSGDNYRGLATLERDEDHPLVRDPGDFSPYFARETLSGNLCIDELALSLAQNEYFPLLVGWHGVGKGEVVKKLAAEVNQPVITINMDSELISADVLGIRVPTDGGGSGLGVEFQPGIIPLAAKHGWWVQIDELPAAPPGVWMALHSLTERNPEIHLKSANKRYKPHPRFRIIGTANPSTAEYRGNFDQNTASESRFEHIWIDYLPKDKEMALLDCVLNGNDHPGVDGNGTVTDFGGDTLSPAQLESLVDLANTFRDVDNPTDDSDKTHIWTDRDLDLPRLSFRALLKIGRKVERPNTDLATAAKAVVFHACDRNLHDVEAAIQRTEDELA